MEKIYILGHENPDVDSLVSGYILEKVLLKKGHSVEFIVPDDSISEETLQICKRNDFEPNKFLKKIDFENVSNQYILVDHFQRTLAGKIICIIDHHPTEDKIEIKDYYNQKVSSTACLIGRENEELLDEFDLKLVVLATMVDTASFHSSKGREEDKDWIIKICDKYNFDYDKLYMEGLCITLLDDIEKASLNGLKKYNFSGKKVECSYIQIEDYKKSESNIEQIVSKLQDYRDEKQLFAFIFIVYDMNEFKTMYYLITKDGITKRFYDIYASRGNTIIPEVQKIISLI